MTAEDRISKLLEQLREEIADVRTAEYARGAEDTIRRIHEFTSAQLRGQQPPVVQEPETEDDIIETEDGGRRRAPKGLVGVLVKRALSDVAPNGLPTNMFKNYAKDDLERMVSPGSIRNELRRGAREGRYREEGGRWFLTSTA